MDIKDYAQYYIGWPCLNTWFQANHSSYNAGWKLTGFIATSPKPFHLETDTEYNWTDSIKLILRKLADITPEEVGEMRLIRDSIDYRVKKHAAVTHWYLKKQFDIFGLIDADLAVDIKTLTK